MIHVIAEIELNAGCLEEFLAEFRKLVPLVLDEDGCLEYGPAIDIASGIAIQQPPRNHVVTVVEKWQGVEHLTRHLSAPHMGPYREAVKGLVIATRLYVLEPA